MEKKAPITVPRTIFPRVPDVLIDIVRNAESTRSRPSDTGVKTTQIIKTTGVNDIRGIQHPGSFHARGADGLPPRFPNVAS